MATKLPLTKPGNVKSQTDQRRPITLYDQHVSSRFPKGRPWWGYTETPVATNEIDQPTPGTVGGLFPGEHGNPFGPNATWSAPWMPATKYFRVKYNDRKLVIDYASMVADYRHAMEAYYEEAVKKAYANGWQAPEFLGPISYQLQQVIGPMPMHPKIPEAAMAGDPWLLGLTPHPNPSLEPLLRRARRQSWSDQWDRVAQTDREEKPKLSDAQRAALAAGREKRRTRTSDEAVAHADAA
jgi:hypothetical protein